MASFETSHILVMKIEGLYSNHPDDSGGETYGGIARNKWPSWDGWKIIDEYKRKPNFPNNMKEDEKLYELERDFYIKEFWIPIGGNKFSYTQNIGNKLYSIAVNMGTVTAVKFLQETLNFMRFNAKDELFPKLSLDGIFGNQVLNALNVIFEITKNTERLSFKIYSCLHAKQINKFFNIIEKNPSQIVFANGWLNRAIEI